MKVIINAQSGAKGSTSTRPIPKLRADGKSGAFLVTLLDSSDVDSELLEFAKTTANGTAIIRRYFQGAYEMWIPRNITKDGKPCEPDSGQSFYDAIVARLNEVKAEGARLAFEFEPRITSTARGELVQGKDVNDKQMHYQTITIGFNQMGLKRFSVVHSSPVEGL